MGKELEMKYDCTAVPSVLETIEKEFPGNWETIAMESTYFDNKERDFAGNHWTLRLRMENGVQVITCKTPGEGGARNEWECPATELPAGISQLIAMGAPSCLSDYFLKGLSPVCGAKFTRRRKLLADTFGEAELALDEGILTGGEESLFFREVEVELKEGSEDAFRLWCQSFCGKYQLLPQKKSKYARAVALSER